MAFNEPQVAAAGDRNWTYGAPGANQQLVPRKPEGTFSVLGGSASGSGYSQVQNLAQLKQIMGALSGVPPDLRDKLITQLTGIPFKGERQMALESAVTQARTKHQLEAPMREAEFGRKLEEGQYRREQQGETRDYRNEVLQMRQDALKYQKYQQLDHLSEIGKNSIDPKVKAVISQILMRELGMIESQQPPMEGPPKGGKAKITVRRVQ
jgi:hypothetical protein